MNDKVEALLEYQFISNIINDHPCQPVVVYGGLGGPRSLLLYLCHWDLACATLAAGEIPVSH